MSSKLLPLPNSANPAKKMPAVGFGALYLILQMIFVVGTFKANLELTF